MRARAVLVCLLLLICGAQAAPSQDAGAVSAREFSECADCPQMVAIPAGKFVMGSPAHEAGRFDSEGPQHSVTLKAFALGKYDVTSAEFLTFLRATGYQPKPCNPTLGLGWQIGGRGIAYAPSQAEPPRWPAVCLDWKDAQAYVAWLNVRARAAHPSIIGTPYRLPSEAEWEYAARAGTVTARWWGEDIGASNANCNGCGSIWDNRVLSPVDAFTANPFGLYGMLGNAWQWTQDCWHPDYTGAPADGSAWSAAPCTKHVIRGGAWNNVPIFIRAAARSGAGNDTADSGYDYSSLSGLRVARNLP